MPYRSTGLLDDETWTELCGLRKRCQEQDQQLDRQQQIILALQRLTDEAAAGGASGAGPGRDGAQAGAGASPASMLALQQQVRLLEVSVKSGGGCWTRLS